MSDPTANANQGVMLENDLWSFATRVYAVPEVAAACLAAQDEYSIDVNLLLYGAWLGKSGKRLDKTHLDDAEARVAHWRQRSVQPLRRVRRYLKEVQGAEALRQRVSELELAAEQYQLALLYAGACMANGLSEAGNALAQNLRLVFSVTAGESPGWESLFQRLLAALSGVAETETQ